MRIPILKNWICTKKYLWRRLMKQEKVFMVITMAAKKEFVYLRFKAGILGYLYPR